jgi:hypothetical protein
VLPGKGWGSIYGLSCEYILGPVLAWAASESGFETREVVFECGRFLSSCVTLSVAGTVRGEMARTVRGGVARTVRGEMARTVRGGVAQKLGVADAF